MTGKGKKKRNLSRPPEQQVSTTPTYTGSRPSAKKLSTFPAQLHLSRTQEFLNHCKLLHSGKKRKNAKS